MVAVKSCRQEERKDAEFTEDEQGVREENKDAEQKANQEAEQGVREEQPPRRGATTMLEEVVGADEAGVGDEDIVKPNTEVANAGRLPG